MGYSIPILVMLDTTTQTIAVQDTEQLITFNTTIISNKIAVTSSSRFTINEAGNYNLTLNFEVVSSGANKTLDVWVKINGTNVANSNSKNILVSTNDQKDVSHNISFALTAGQYIEIFTNGDSTNLSLLATAAGVTPTRPASPSVFLKLVKIP